MAEKVTTMVLKVDLQCSSCYKKIKKILCKFPEIRDQIYDEKQNTVTIVVVCCSPEKVRDKLYCKGGKIIKCIEIIKPKPPGKPKPPPPAPPADKPPPPPADKPPGAPADKPPTTAIVVENPQPPAPPPAPPADKPPAPPPKPPTPVPEKPRKPPPPPAFVPAFVPVCYPPMYPRPVGICCGQCSEGRTDGPCYHGHGRPVPCYDNCGYGPCSCGWNRGCYISRCDYFSEENPSGCTIM